MDKSLKMTIKSVWAHFATFKLRLHLGHELRQRWVDRLVGLIIIDEEDFAILLHELPGESLSFPECVVSKQWAKVAYHPTWIVCNS